MFDPDDILLIDPPAFVIVDYFDADQKDLERLAT